MDGLEHLREHAAELTRRGWGLALSLLRNRDDAMDAVQQALLVATRKPQQIPGGNIWPWFARVVALEVANLRRKRGRMPAALEGDNAMDAQPGPQQQVEERELGAQLALALAELPRAQHDALMLTQFGGLSYEDAARSLDMPLGTFNHQVRNGLARLRTRFGVEDKAISRGLIAMPVLAVPDSLLPKALEIIAGAKVATAGSAALAVGATMSLKIMAALVLAMLIAVVLISGFGRNLWSPTDRDAVAQLNNIPLEHDNNMFSANSAAAAANMTSAGAGDRNDAPASGENGVSLNRPAEGEASAGTSASKDGSAAAAAKTAEEVASTEVPYIKEDLSLVAVPKDLDNPNLVSRPGENAAPWVGSPPLGVTPDGKVYVTGGSVLRWCSTENGKQKFAHRLLTPAVQLAISPDGKLLATVHANQAGSSAVPAKSVVRFWDNKTGELLGRLPSDDGISRLQFSADGKWLVASSRGWRAVLAWNMRSNAEPRIFRPATGDHVETTEYRSVGLSNDSRILTAHHHAPGRSAAIVTWDFETGKHQGEIHFADFGVTGTFKHPEPRAFERVYNVAYSPDGLFAVALVPQAFIYVPEGFYHGCAAQVLLVDIREKKLVHKLANFSLPPLAPDPDDPRATNLLPAYTCTMTSPPVIHPGKREVAISGIWPDASDSGENGVIQGAAPQTIVWNFDGKVIACFPHLLTGPAEKTPLELAYDGKGDRLFAAFASHVRELRAGAAEEPTRTRQAAGHESHVLYAEFSPDGRTLYSCDSDGVLLAWDAVSGVCIDRIDSVPQRLSGAMWKPFALSPDGSEIVYAEAAWESTGGGSRKRTTLDLVWRNTTSRSVFRRVDLQRLGNPILLQYSKNGSMVIALGDQSMELHCFDAKTGALAKTLSRLSLDFYSHFALSQDGMWFADASASLLNLETRDEKTLSLPLKQHAPHPARDQAEYGADVRFSSDGKHIMLLQFSGNIEFHDAATGKYIETKSFGAPPVKQMLRRFALPSDESFVAISKSGYGVGNGFEICRYRMSDQKLVQKISLPYGYIYQIVVSPDGRFMASVGDAIRVWRVTDDYQEK